MRNTIKWAGQLYESEPEYRKWADECADILKPAAATGSARNSLCECRDSRRTEILDLHGVCPTRDLYYGICAGQVVDKLGIQPDAMIGHSVGEFVAACLGGVFSLKDALHLVATRGRMMQDLPKGSMLAVRLPETETRALLNPQLSIAAINSPGLCVVSGPTRKLRN